MREPRRYLLISAATCALLIGATVALNAVVDPFSMTRLVALEGFNARKPATYQRVRLVKAHDVRHVAPRALVLGTSRSHLGLRTTHAGWSAAPRFNLAFDGATAREMYAYLVHAHAVRPLEQVVLGLDTWQLSNLPSGTRAGFDPGALLRDDGVLARARVALADLRTLASLDTVEASLDTLAAQGSGEPDWLAPDGQRLGEVFFRRPGEMFHDRSPRAYFEAYDRDEIGWRRPDPAPSTAAAPVPAPDPGETSLAWVYRIVELCRAEGIDLRVFLTPAHAHQLEIAAAAGEWEALEAAKRALVAHLDADAARHPDRAPIPLWDFASYSSVTTEPLPPAGTKQEMRYYWDSSHFKEVVGDWVLDRVFGTASSAIPAPADFGVRLDAGNLEASLAATRAARDAYRARDAAEVRAIEALVAQVLSPGAEVSGRP